MLVERDNEQSRVVSSTSFHDRLVKFSMFFRLENGTVKWTFDFRKSNDKHPRSFSRRDQVIEEIRVVRDE